MGQYDETSCYVSVIRCHLCGGQSLGTVIAKDHIIIQKEAKEQIAELGYVMCLVGATSRLSSQCHIDLIYLHPASYLIS